MKTDKKDVVLLALYGEYCRDDGCFDRVTAATLEMEKPVFRWALMKLETEGYVEVVRWLPPGAGCADVVIAVNRKALRLTLEGVKRADELAGTRGMRDAEKLARLADMLRAIGCQIAANLLWAALQ